MDAPVKAFLEEHHSAIMATIRKGGAPHVARISCGLVDGELWSSGTETRVRTGHLRRDNRATLCVVDDSDRYSWMGLETTVDILDGPDRAELNLKLYRVLAGEPDDLDEYMAAMEKEQRLIYRFNVIKAYGQF